MYDAGGQRVRKVWEKPGETVDRVYLGGFEIVRTRGAAALREEWEALHVLDGPRRQALIEVRTVDDGAPDATVVQRYQLDDHLGTACLELDEAADVISYEEYHPHGSTAFHSVRGGEEVPRKRYRFTGMERDAESGLQYHSARYYAPWLGRWAAIRRGWRTVPIRTCTAAATRSGGSISTDGSRTDRSATGWSSA